MTRLSDFIQQTPLIDSHEHLNREHIYLESDLDLMKVLFSHYLLYDLVSAGISQHAADLLCDATNPDLEARWHGIKEAWSHCQHTGYGRAVRWLAETVYDIESITPQTIAEAAPIFEQRHRPGERRRILRDEGNLDHVQVDRMAVEVLPDASGPDFFLYDLSWAAFSNGHINAETLFDQTGVNVTNLKTLRQAMESLFEQYGPLAIAVKSQHAYNRTLYWEKHDDAEAEAMLARVLRGEDIPVPARLPLGDWCIARGAELAAQYRLPFKIHTGFYARNDFMVMDRIRPSHLSNLLAAYPQTRFVLMHIGYPYQIELLALGKHFSNLYIDLCWAWSIDPYSSADFLRRALHALPVNKIFAFGGDTFYPDMALAYAQQARDWLNRTLQAEINDNFLSEDEAIGIAQKMMQANQRACFDIDGTRAAIAAASYGSRSD